MTARGRLAARRATLALVLALAAPAAAFAQPALLDRPTRAGALTLYPSVEDPNAYYYVVDKAQLARNASGRPEFSFLRYVENVRTGADAPEAREGRGGGIVHAVVELNVGAERLREAERALQSVSPAARIVGPMAPTSGRFALVSSIASGDANATQVVGIGNAPLLDGGKAALSIALTRRGAEMLKQSFAMARPDVSFSFEMDLAGYRSPARATIEADFDRVYRHRSFAAGVATPMLASEIRSAFDELRASGAIRITQVGGDASMEALVSTAYGKLLETMFAPLADLSGPPVVAATPAGPGLADRAAAMLAEERARVRSENAAIRAENAKARAATTAAPATPAAPKPPANDEGRRSDERSAGEVRARARAERVAKHGDDEWGSPLAPEAPVRDSALVAADRASEAADAAVTSAPAAAPAREESALPELAVLAAYEMKTVRQQGTFRLDLNKFTPDRRTIRFDENIGDLSPYASDPLVFRDVNLDDPLFRQREVVAFVDGLGARDFGEYVNFVTVQLRKRHADGSETNDEVRIDRTNFNRDGNRFALVYGWKGDEDRRKWLDYEYRATWSFAGGASASAPWARASIGAVALVPPFRRHVVEVQGEAADLEAAGVRAVAVTLYFQLGGAEQSKRVTLDVARRKLSERVEFVLPSEALDYDYEVTWQLKGSRTATSGRRHGTSSLLFVDEVSGG